MAKITMKNYQAEKTLTEHFDDYIEKKRAQRDRKVCEKTIATYYSKFYGVSNYFNFNVYPSQFKQADIDTLIYNMEEGIGANGNPRAKVKDITISSYLATLRNFFKWLAEENICYITVKQYSYTEQPKEVYTNEEILRLMKKPNMRKCNFGEYRNWVIICFLLNCGCRASTLVNVLIKDLDFENDMIFFRHMKARNQICVPMGHEMKSILREYLRIRQGNLEDYLFPSEDNQMLTVSGLQTAIQRYNNNRGVAKTSLHLFRHYYAKTYLQNGGEVTRLQKILGHKKIEMTVKYANLYGADTKRGFEDFAPLSVLSASAKRITMR